MRRSILLRLSLVIASLVYRSSVDSFSITAPSSKIATTTTRRFLADASKNEWTGQVVDNADGQIRGCSLTSLGLTEWSLRIDGVEADLGQFSQAVYQKVVQTAKQERFQGFRPGTIPPHLETTYRAFAMDECARETVLEALQQNNIRPFENCRTEMKLEQFSIPPVAKTSKSKKKKKKRKKKTQSDDGVVAERTSEAAVVDEPPPVWRTFDTMKEAIDAGWKPGQSFSFVANNLKGQQLKDDKDVDKAEPIIKF